MKVVRTLGMLFTALLVLAGCASGADDAGLSDSGVRGGAVEEMAPQDAPPGDASDSSGIAESAEGAGASAEAPSEREIVRTGSLTLVAGDVSNAADQVVELAESAGGRVDARSETAAAGHQDPSAWLTLRVPADELTATIDAVEGLGEVRDVHVSSDDVTRYGQDLDARIGALETSTERLVELMNEADSSEALIAAETALSERQADLEALRSERNYLSDQVAMSTLEVSILPTGAAEFDPGGFLGGIVSGWNALVSAASGVLVALGAALPWAAALGIPIAAIIWLLRRRRGNRRSKGES